MPSTDVDVNEFEALSKPKSKKKRCRVGAAVEQLNPMGCRQLEAAFAADRTVITVGAIAQWLERRGHDVNHSSINSHRMKRCTCYE